jgi:hypothetical protein
VVESDKGVSMDLRYVRLNFKYYAVDMDVARKTRAIKTPHGVVYLLVEDGPEPVFQALDASALPEVACVPPPAETPKPEDRPDRLIFRLKVMSTSNRGAARIRLYYKGNRWVELWIKPSEYDDLNGYYAGGNDYGVPMNTELYEKLKLAIEQDQDGRID